MGDAEVVFRRLLDEGLNRGDLEVCDEIVASTYAEHQRFGPGHPDGPEGVKAVFRSLRTAYSDFRLDVDALVVADDVVWARCVATGTNDGPFMGHPPTGRQMRVDVFESVRVRDGKIVEHWGLPDRLGALIQLGHVQASAEARLAVPS